VAEASRFKAVTRPLLLIWAIAALGLSSCGDSSGTSEEEAATLLENRTPASGVACMREGDRRFYCNAKNQAGERLKLYVAVSESGDATSDIRCLSVEEAIYLIQEIPQGRACNGIGPPPKE
jgi:hypothetical protein